MRTHNSSSSSSSSSNTHSCVSTMRPPVAAAAAATSTIHACPTATLMPPGCRNWVPWVPWTSWAEMEPGSGPTMGVIKPSGNTWRQQPPRLWTRKLGAGGSHVASKNVLGPKKGIQYNSVGNVHRIKIQLKRKQSAWKWTNKWSKGLSWNSLWSTLNELVPFWNVVKDTLQNHFQMLESFYKIILADPFDSSICKC